VLNEFSEHSLGHTFEDSEVTIFFGNNESSREALTMCFPDYRLSYVKQTHSRIAVESPGDETREADGQVTSEKRVALCIRTADCVPVMIHDPVSGQIAGIHAGWRGVENGAVIAAGEQLKKKSKDLNSARAWIGPHIGAASFEVGIDVSEKLSSAFERVRGHATETEFLHLHEDPLKMRVDLSIIVRAQLMSLGISESQIFELDIDTVKSQQHDSYRRDHKTGSRQTSFIALK
jgi:YfiH family protein